MDGTGSGQFPKVGCDISCNKLVSPTTTMLYKCSFVHTCTQYNHCWKSVIFWCCFYRFLSLYLPQQLNRAPGISAIEWTLPLISSGESVFNIQMGTLKKKQNSLISQDLVFQTTMKLKRNLDGNVSLWLFHQFLLLLLTCTAEPNTGHIQYHIKLQQYIKRYTS